MHATHRQPDAGAQPPPLPTKPVDVVTEASRESFPASDPPGWVGHGQAAGASKESARCELCGNEYDKTFTVEFQGRRHIFDSFECAIHALAPACDHCGCKVVGHGFERKGTIYCCSHCARHSDDVTTVEFVH